MLYYITLEDALVGWIIFEDDGFNYSVPSDDDLRDFLDRVQADGLVAIGNPDVVSTDEVMRDGETVHQINLKNHAELILALVGIGYSTEKQKPPPIAATKRAMERLVASADDTGFDEVPNE